MIDHGLTVSCRCALAATVVALCLRSQTQIAYADDLTTFTLENGIISHQFDPNLPSIVLVHGWAPGCLSTAGCDTSYNNSDGPQQISSITSALINRGVTDGLNANIFTFNWRGAYTPTPLTNLGNLSDALTNDLQIAAAVAPSAGIALAADLRNVFEPSPGIEYVQPIHFIGYSLGTVVVSQAAYDLGFGSDHTNIGQVTLLDPPFTLGLAVTPNEIYSMLPTGLVAHVDNYIGLPGVSFGSTLAGADINQLLLADHLTIPAAYAAIVNGPGFISAATGTPFPYPTSWSRPTTVTQWVSGSGTWTDSTGWSGGVVPNNGPPSGDPLYFDAVIGGGASPTIVSIFGINPTVDSVHLIGGGPDPLLTINNGVTLTTDGPSAISHGAVEVYGTWTNGNDIEVDPAGALKLGGGLVDGGTIHNYGLIDTSLSGVPGMINSRLFNDGTIIGTGTINDLVNDSLGVINVRNGESLFCPAITKV